MQRRFAEPIAAGLRPFLLDLVSTFASDVGFASRLLNIVPKLRFFFYW